MIHPIQITIDGTVHQIHRGAAQRHHDAILDAMGVETEAGLQQALDSLRVVDFYDFDGQHLGPDVNGLEMFWPTEMQAWVGKRVEGGDIPEDHDTGTVLRVMDETAVEVAWDSGTRSYTPVSILTEI